MQSLDDAKHLAFALVQAGGKFGVKTQAVVSDMSQPLGQFVGNSHEVYECIKVLRNEAGTLANVTTELSLDLSARMVLLAGVADSIESANDRVRSALSSGLALEKLKLNIECQGGDPSVCDDPEILLDPSVLRVAIRANDSGFISEIDTNCVGIAVSEIGGGRVTAADQVDHAVGYECVAKLGDRVSLGDTIGTLFCRDQAHAEATARKITAAYRVVSEPPLQAITLIYDVISL